MGVALAIWFVCVVTGVLLANSDIDVWPVIQIRTFVNGVGEAVGDTNVVVLWLIALVVLLPATAVHEAGHAIAGRLLGFRVHSIRVWRIEIHAPFRLGWYRGPRSGVGGWAILSPDQMENLAPRAAAMAAAGPVANLLSVAVVLALPLERGLFLGIFVLCSLFLGVVNLVPFRTGAMHTDGHRILIMLKDRRRGERWLAMLMLQKDVIDGIAPEFFSPEYVAVATAVKDKSGDTVSAHMMAYASAFQQHRDDDAARLLETCLAYSCYTSPLVQQVLIADAAMFQGRRRGRADLAGQWLNDLPAKTALPWLRDWAEAGVLHARGDAAAALAKLDAIESAIRKRVHPLQRKVSLDSVHRWRQELQQLAPVLDSRG